MNHLKTFLLMLLLTALFLFLGGLIGGDAGVIIALAFALLVNFSSYWFSDRLAVAMTRSRPLSEAEAPGVYRAAREVASSAGMPMPRLYLMPSEQPNAFATGRDSRTALVSVTAGLLRMLDYEELKGVIAHEMAHIRNRDILVGTMAAVFAGALMFLARMGMWGMMFGGGRRSSGGGGHPAIMLIRLAAIVLAPLAAILIRMAISRSREYLADASGARFAGSASGLARALEKMEYQARGRPMAVSEAASHMFIINPLSARGMGALFSTHPPLRERVARLRRGEGRA